MSPDAISATGVEPKLRFSCFGARHLSPRFERIASAVRSARIRSKRILAGNPLSFCPRQRPAPRDVVDVSEALNALKRGTVLAEKCAFGWGPWWTL